MRLREKYAKEVIPKMKERFGYRNDLAVPRIVKVVVNTGFNPATKGEKAQEELIQNLSLITGQRPRLCQAKRAEASFKTREGMVIGLAVTLRGQRMYDFLDRLIHIALPRGRDFRGLLEKNIILFSIAGGDVENDCGGQHGRPDDILVGDINTHQVHTAGEGGHHQCTDQRPGDPADPASRRYAPDKRGCNRVQFE